MKPNVIRRIASWEVSRQLQGVTPVTVIVAVVLFAVSGGVVAFAGTPDINEGLYTVGVVEGSKYTPAIEAADNLRVAEFDSRDSLRDAYDEGSVDVAIDTESGVGVPQSSQKGRAALAQTKDAIDDYNNEQLRLEENQSAAFPVGVNVLYIEQSSGPVADRATDGQTQNDSTNQTTSEEEQREAAREIAEQTTSTTGSNPSDLRPPFPFESLLISFAFLVPMNFVIQTYASSIIDERLNRRGELLLVAPVSPYDIVAGKTLPYMLALIGIISAIAVAAGAGLVSVLALLPFAFAYLAAGFLAGIFARSYQELTFVILTVSVLFTAFAFIPAIFTNILPIASISPLTVVVEQLQGSSVPIGSVLFSTIPLTVVGSLMFIFGIGIYKEENLFAQRPVPAKVLDALAAQMSGRRSPFKISLLAIPFVFVGELLVVAGLFVVPEVFSIPLLLGLIAVVEETAKGVSVYAGFEQDIFERNGRVAVLVGAASGLGFFVGEKLFVAAQVVGLQRITLGEAAFSTPVGATAPDPLVAVGLLVAPLALHVVTAIVSSLGAARGRISWLAGLAAASIIHLAYNLTVVMLLA